MFGRLFATGCLRTRAGLTAIAPTRGLSYEGSEVIERLVTLEREQERLKYYVSLLAERQANVIKLTYFEGRTQEDVAVKLGLAKRTVQTLKAQAINDLAAMYDYTTELR